MYEEKNIKLLALADWLECKPSEINVYPNNTFFFYGREYLVLEDSEADIRIDYLLKEDYDLLPAYCMADILSDCTGLPSGVFELVTDQKSVSLIVEVFSSVYDVADTLIENEGRGVILAVGDSVEIELPPENGVKLFAYLQ